MGPPVQPDVMHHLRMLSGSQEMATLSFMILYNYSAGLEKDVCILDLKREGGEEREAWRKEA